MASYIDPKTKKVNISVDIPEEDWIRIPSDLAESLKDVESRFIVLEHGVPREMSQVEKTVYLSTIVTPVIKDTLSIIHDILGSCTSQEQARRLILSVRKYPDFLLYLDDSNWDGAKGVILEAESFGDITDADASLVISKI